jgi:CRP/FNR family transcriptional regulator, cyclic AMP receptor protein
MMAPSATSMSQREAISPHGLPALSKLSHIVRMFWRGTTIYSPDDPTTHLYSIISGRVKILRASASGQRKIISIRYRGDLFGESALACGAVEARRSDEAVALDTTRVAVFRVEDLWRVMRIDPAAARDALGYLAERLDEAHRQIESLVFDDNSRRLMRALIDLSSEASRAGESSVRLTHEEIAGLIGSAREVVTGLMLDLRRRGLIDYKRGEVRPCLPKLARFLQEEGQRSEPF